MGKLLSILGLIFILLNTSYSQSLAKEYDVLSSQAERTLLLLNNFALHPSLDDVAGLAQFNNPKVIETVLTRLYMELKSSRNNAPLVTYLGFVVLKYAQYPEYDKEYLLSNMDRFTAIRNMAMEAYSADPQMRSFVAVMIQAQRDVLEYRKQMADKSPKKETLKLTQNPGDTLVVAEDSSKEEIFVSPAERLSKFSEYLHRHLIGQPEIKEALYDLEFETLVKGPGNTREPPLFFLMGLPGNGKDTSVEVYIDALWGKRGAHREHMYRVKVQRSTADAWSLLGSAKGYVGSETLPDFVHFLVKHSGGKYLITKGSGAGGKEYEKVEIHPTWKPGEVLPGFFPPERGAVYLNEFHDWSAEAKSLVLKEFLEKGIIRISGSGGGETELEIPGLRIFAATNEGISLITNRNADGLREGPPLEYDAMMRRHELVSPNKDLLKQELARTSLRNPPGTPKDQQIGTPEEVRNRVHTSRMILLEPLSPSQLKEIVALNIDYLNEQFFDAEKGVFGSFEIKASEGLVEFIQEYEYIAEDNARPLKDKVRAILEYPFYQALKDGAFTPEMVKDGVTLDIRKNADKTYSLILLKGLENAKEVLREQPIRYTLKELDKEPITDEKIDSLLGLEQRLRGQVFGQEKAVKLVSEAALLSEEIRHSKRDGWGNQEKATSFAFLGPSSTGKSELAKALVRELYPEYGEERRVDIDFNKIQSKEDLKEYIWGRRHGREVMASEFMRKYDQYDGDILFVFEEGTNTPRELLRSLYDIFRESHPKFADGKDRPMTRVTVIMTGNAGIEWYTNIPKHVPMKVQIAAWRKVYEKAMKNPSYQRATVEKYLPEPLVNRIGETNTIWFSPLDFQAIRELSVLKTSLFLDKLKPSSGRRGWEVGFRNQEEANKIIEIIESEGFNLYEQGASIDRYVDAQIQRGLRSLLLKNKVPSGARVVLVPREDQTEDVIKKQQHVKIDTYVEGTSKPLELQVYAQKREEVVPFSRVDQILTAAHEAGHELVRHVLLGDKYESKFITILPGVAEIGGQWIYYAGLASSKQTEKMILSREAAIREIAGLLGGYLGEQAVSVGMRHGPGKSNDIERATKVAENMILKWGLEPRWGSFSSESQELSQERRKLKEELISDILKEAEALGRQALQVNKELHIEMTRELSRKGELKAEDLRAIYERMGVRSTSEWNSSMKPRLSSTSLTFTHDIKLLADVDIQDVANIDEIVEAERQAEIARAETPRPLPIIKDFKSEKSFPMVLAEKVKTRELAQESVVTCSGFFK